MNYNREDIPLDVIDYIDELQDKIISCQTEIWRLQAIEKERSQQKDEIADLKLKLEAIEAAQADFNKRVLSNLVHGG